MHSIELSSTRDTDDIFVQTSDDTEAEQQKEEEKRKAEEERLQREKDSATSTKGSNTPSGRPKHTDALKKPAQSRKRLGSPGSDASGTDTSRKKAKSKHPTSQPISRPMSPSAAHVSRQVAGCDQPTIGMNANQHPGR